MAHDVKQSLLSPAVNDFSVSLFHRLCCQAGQGNVFASPFSISTALSILMMGARHESERQLRIGLMLNQLDAAGLSVHDLFRELLQSMMRDDSRVLMSNYVLTQQSLEHDPVLDKYTNDCKHHYYAKVNSVNFATDGDWIKEAVNSWVRQSTRGMIPAMLSNPPDPLTRCMILNAIYFKDRWARQFSASSTRKKPFYNQGSRETRTDFMIMRDKEFPYACSSIAGQTTHMLELQYANRNYSMFILLPDQRDGLSRIMVAADFEHEIKRFLSNTVLHDTRVNIFIPKFEFETDYDLVSTLRFLGITDVFSDAADLTGIMTQSTRLDDKLIVSQVKHRAVIKVDEEGTVAAAATVVMMGFGCAALPRPPVKFLADHPFIFLIRDNVSGVILFFGKVEEL